MGRKKKDTNIINIEELEIENDVEIDYDKLALAIVKAKQIEKQNEEQEKIAALAKWRKEMGYNEHADKKGLIRKVLRFFNWIKVTWNLMFISEKKHIEASPTVALIQEGMVKFFQLIQWTLTAMAVCLIGLIIFSPDVEYTIIQYFLLAVYAIISFVFSRIFRLMAIEVKQMSNREQVLGIFAAVLAVVPLIEMVVKLFVEVG